MPPGSDQSQSKVRIVGSWYSVLTREEIHYALLSDAKARKPGYVCVSNVHTTMMGFFDKAYQRITNEATYAVPDGVPLVWAMKSFGALDQDRIRGPSLMRELINLGRSHGLKHYLYGGSPATVATLKITLEKEFPGAEIVGAESPPFRSLEAISPEEWEADAKRINESGAHLVWVGLGAPKQECWMWEQRNRLSGLMLGVGAAFDLLSGRIPEAPIGFQKLGLEWLYRFYREPKRLWRRYIFNNPAYLCIWGAQLIRAKLLGRNYKQTP